MMCGDRNIQIGRAAESDWGAQKLIMYRNRNIQIESTAETDLGRET